MDLLCMTRFQALVIHNKLPAYRSIMELLDVLVHKFQQLHKRKEQKFIDEAFYEVAAVQLLEKLVAAAQVDIDRRIDALHQLCERSFITDEAKLRYGKLLVQGELDIDSIDVEIKSGADSAVLLQS